MNPDQVRRLVLVGGGCGIVSVLCYVAAIMIPMGHLSTYFLAMMWPILSIVYCFALYQLIAQEQQGPWNHLGFIMAVLAFTIVAEMLSVQLAVGMGVEEYRVSGSQADQVLYRLVNRVTRLVDMGLDVAWDMFIGTALVLIAVPMTRHSRFGILWSLPSAVLGLLLIGLNAWTFPWPPNTRGLSDIGPLIGGYIICVSLKLIRTSVRRTDNAIENQLKG